MADNTIVCSSDWHITASTPTSRLPGYQQQQFNKIAWILAYCRKISSPLYIAGDIFEKAREPRNLLNQYLKLFVEYSDIKIYACVGQHDQLWHSKDISDTNIEILFSSGLFQHIGIAWGDTNSIIDSDILLSHFCVTDKPNKFIDCSVTAKDYLSMVANRIVITGDYHQAHYLKTENRILINPGSIMREASDTIKRKPSIYVVNTESLELETIYIPIEPVETVFNMEMIKTKKDIKNKLDETSIDITKYIETAKKQQEIKPNFPKCVDEIIQNMEPTEQVKQEVTEMMSEYYS